MNKRYKQGWYQLYIILLEYKNTLKIFEKKLNKEIC